MGATCWTHGEACRENSKLIDVFNLKHFTGVEVSPTAAELGKSAPKSRPAQVRQTRAATTAAAKILQAQLADEVQTSSKWNQANSHAFGVLVLFVLDIAHLNSKRSPCGLDIR